jgi:hypothetical protein
VPCPVLFYAVHGEEWCTFAKDPANIKLKTEGILKALAESFTPQ